VLKVAVPAGLERALAGAGEQRHDFGDLDAGADCPGVLGQCQQSAAGSQRGEFGRDGDRDRLVQGAAYIADRDGRVGPPLGRSMSSLSID
jgi:hypothetical protein